MAVPAQTRLNPTRAPSKDFRPGLESDSQPDFGSYSASSASAATAAFSAAKPAL